MEMFGLFFYCVFSLSTLRSTFGVPIDEHQLRQLEKQLFYIEEKLENEAKMRRESVKSIMNKLYEFGENFNTPEESGHFQKEDVDNEQREKQFEGWNKDSVAHVLLTAFGEEKKNNRRVERDLKNLLKTNNNRMQLDLNDLQKTISDIIQSNHDILNIVEHLGEDVKGLKKSEKESSREILTRLNVTDLFLNLRRLTDQIFETVENQNRKFESCQELYKNGFTANGLYDIYPDHRAVPLRVYCDQDTDGGGWIVFQRREDGSENFYRNWLDYKFGFGNPEGEFWLGNGYLHLLTSSCCHELRVDMEDFENERRYAKYSNFSIGSKDTNYLLTVKGYTGDAGNSLGGHNGHQFSTHDRDNDIYGKNCAVSYKGAWWYTKCHSSNLNGQYLKGKHESFADGVNWKHWKTYHYSLKLTEMKLR